MPVNDFRKKVDKLPPSVKKVMLSNKTFEIISIIYEKHKLNAKQQEKVAQITGKTLIKDVPLNEFINTLKSQTNLNIEKSKSLAFDIIQNLLLPIKRYFPNAEDLMKKLKSEHTSLESPNIVNLKNK